MRAKYGANRELWPKEDEKNARATTRRPPQPQEVPVKQTEPKKKNKKKKTRPRLLIRKKVPKNAPWNGRASIGKCKTSLNNYFRKVLNI
jgi:hypothetical protein